MFMDHPKNTILQIIKNDNINKLKWFIQNNEVKNEEYDLLTFAIENNASISIIKIILEQYETINYIYYESHYRRYDKDDINIEKLAYHDHKIPIFSAIAKNNFYLANYLIKYHSADAKYKDIFYYFYSQGNENITLLNKKNIKYILINKFFNKNSLQYLILNIIDMNKIFFIKYLEIIFSYTSFNNELILKLLNFYYNKTPISNNQLIDIIKKDNIIFEKHFIQSIKRENYEVTKLLFQNNIMSRSELYEYINKYFLTEYNIKFHGYKVIEDVLKYKSLNFEIINLKDILLQIVNSEKYEIIKPIIHDIIYHPSYQYNVTNLEILFKESCYNDDGLKICYYIIELIYYHPIFDLNKLNLENIFINIIQSDNNRLLIKEFIEKLINFNYNCSIIDFENILKEISYNPYGDDFMEYFLNLLTKYNICSVDTINFKSILMESYKNSEYSNTNISKYLLKVIFNIKNNNINDIKIELLTQCDTKFLSIIINIVIEMGNYKLLKYILENESLKSKININDKDINNNYPIFKALYTASHLAHSHTLDNIKIFDYLINYGANVNLNDSNNNPLFIIALYVENYLFINYILSQKVELEKYVVNKYYSEPILSSIINDNLEIFQKLFSENNTHISNFKAVMDVFFDHIGDENFDFYNNIRKDEINIKNKKIYSDNFIEELLKSDNLDEEFNKFISIEEDVENINTNTYSINNINIKPDTSIIRNNFTLLTLSYLLNKKNIFKYILDHCDINEVDTLQYSIMHYAVLKEDIVTVNLLLEKGANINLYQHYNGRGHSAFDIAIAIGNDELFNIFIDSGKVLLDQPNQRKETPLVSIINHPLLDLETKKKWIKRLIEKGANVNLINVGEYCALAQTVKCHSIELMKFLVEEYHARIDNYDQNNNSPLIFAILEEDMEIIQYLIDHGADVNHTDEEKQTPLEIAIRWGSLSDVKILIENGANVNTVMLDYQGKDISLLGYALQVHEPDIANYLIQHGANLNYRNSKNETVYDVAYEQIDKDNLEVMKILVDYDINGFKERIIWDSIKHDDEDHIEFFKFLIENQVDINIKDKDNNTPLGIAILSKNEELVDYLLKNNANILNINNYNQNIYDLALNNINNDNNSDNDKGKIILQKLMEIDIVSKLKK